MLKIILSQSFDRLARCLAAALEAKVAKFTTVTIFVPNVSVKQFLMLSLAMYSPNRVVAGCKISTIDEFLHVRFPQIATNLELRVLLYKALKEESDSSLQGFLQNDTQKLNQLTEALSSIFYSYGKSTIPDFEKISHPSSYWQSKIFAKIFLEGSFKTLQQISKEVSFLDAEVHFFGFGYLPEAYIPLVLNQKNAIFYGFSPCCHFWQDTLTHKQEAKFLNRALKKNISFSEIEKAQELFSFTPGLLASLGQLGRDFFSQIDLESQDVEMVFAPIEDATVLGCLQREIVTFERQDFSNFSADDSIKIVKTGSSQLQQVIALKNEILSLCYEGGLQFSDILVLSPNMEQYIKHVEYVFTQNAIPYRFCHVSLEKQSSFYLAFLDLIELVKNPISVDGLKNLLQRPSFYQKLGIYEDVDIEKCCRWLEKIFHKSSDFAQGVILFYTQSLQMYGSVLENEALRSFPYTVDLPIQDLDLFEKFVGCFLKLIEKTERLKNVSMNLGQWADAWESLEQDFLVVLEGAIEQQAFQAIEGSLKNLRSSFAKLPQIEVPFMVIEKTLCQGMKTDLHANCLQSVTFTDFQEGSIVSVKGVMLLGMEEDLFPKKQSKMSLDFSQNNKVAANLDRYLFLQAVLNAKKFLRIFYGHINSSDGKKQAPSIVVQELISSISHKHKEETFCLFAKEPLRDVLFSFSETKIEKKKKKITVAELTSFAKNPWKFFLKKCCDIHIEDRQERSFAALRSLVVKQSLSWPIDEVLQQKKALFPSAIEEAFCVDVLEKNRVLQNVLNTWEETLQPIELLQSISPTDGFVYKGILQCPSIQIDLDCGSSVEIVGGVTHCISQGYLHLGDDTISSCLKVWPEILVALVSLEKDHVFFAKSMKNKKVEDPKRALQSFVQYFLNFEETLSPLHPNFAEGFLRNKKNRVDWDMEFLDPADQWMLMRMEKLPPEVLLDRWKGLACFFSSLIELYPVRGSYEEV